MQRRRVVRGATRIRRGSTTAGVSAARATAAAVAPETQVVQQVIDGVGRGESWNAHDKGHDGNRNNGHRPTSPSTKLLPALPVHRRLLGWSFRPFLNPHTHPVPPLPDSPDEERSRGAVLASHGDVLL